VLSVDLALFVGVGADLGAGAGLLELDAFPCVVDGDAAGAATLAAAGLLVTGVGAGFDAEAMFAGRGFEPVDLIVVAAVSLVLPAAGVAAVEGLVAETAVGAGAGALAEAESTTTAGALGGAGGGAEGGAAGGIPFVAGGIGEIGCGAGSLAVATSGRFTAVVRALGTVPRPTGKSLSSFSGGRPGNALSGTHPSAPFPDLILTNPFTRLVISTTSPHLSFVCTSKLLSES